MYIDSSLHAYGRQLLDIKLALISEPACSENECHIENTIAAGVLGGALEKSGWAFAIWPLRMNHGASSPESHIPVIHPVTPQACEIRRHNSVALPLFVDWCGAASPFDFNDR